MPYPADVEDIVQEVFYELVEANRLLMPIDHVTGRLFRVARNRISDLFRKRREGTFSDTAPRDFGDEDGELPRIEDLLPSPDTSALPEKKSILGGNEMPTVRKADTTCASSYDRIRRIVPGGRLKKNGSSVNQREGAASNVGYRLRSYAPSRRR